MTNPLPTPSENKALEKLLLAIFFNDVERVIEFKNEYPEIYQKKTHFLIEGHTPFCLTDLTFFNYKIWFDDDWSEEIMPFIEKIRQRTNQMGDYWHAEGIPLNLDLRYNYNQLWEYFGCDDPDDYEEIILEPIGTYLAEGFREIDLRLYNRVQCFDFEEVKGLLKQGARADVHFENDGDSSAFSSVIGAVSFLATCRIIPEFEAFEKHGYDQHFDLQQMFADLMGLAAQGEMYSLLEQYYEGD